MDPCGECGNRGLMPRDYDGVSVLECELCGALQGSAAAVQAVQDARAARTAGVDPQVYGLVRVLAGLVGLRVVDSSGGDRVRRIAPFVRWAAQDARALVQLENLAKSLVLSARALSLAWTIELEYSETLLFALRPRLRGAVATDGEIAAARTDVQALRRAIERDSRLSWWRHPGSMA